MFYYITEKIVTKFVIKILELQKERYDLINIQTKYFRKILFLLWTDFRGGHISSDCHPRRHVLQNLNNDGPS